MVGYGEHETNSRLPELEYSIRKLCHSLFAIMVVQSASIGKALWPQDNLRCFLGTTQIVTVFCSGLVVWVYTLAKSLLQTSPLNGTICSRATLKLRSLEGSLHSTLPMGHSAAHCSKLQHNTLQRAATSERRNQR